MYTFLSDVRQRYSLCDAKFIFFRSCFYSDAILLRIQKFVVEMNPVSVYNHAAYENRFLGNFIVIMIGD